MYQRGAKGPTRRPISPERHAAVLWFTQDCMRAYPSPNNVRLSWDLFLSPLKCSASIRRPTELEDARCTADAFNARITWPYAKLAQISHPCSHFRFEQFLKCWIRCLYSRLNLGRRSKVGIECLLAVQISQKVFHVAKDLAETSIQFYRHCRLSRLPLRCPEPFL